MRFKCKDYGDRRVVKRFALFPIRLPIDPDNRLKTREEVVWLETVYLVQHVECGTFGAIWENKRFATRDEYLKYKEDRDAGN